MSRFEPKPFGRYILIDKIAVGGMAEIYKAKTFGVDGFEKQLAIKRILPHCAADTDFIKMLIDEAKLTVLLSHANIVQVYDLGKVEEDYFISMEFISGTNLREIMIRSQEMGKKSPEEISIYIISEVCKGLDYAHRKTDNDGKQLDIVHRDISPQNILISYEGEVKIVDFGIAKAAHNISHTMAGILKGKIAYMSPEQALGKPIDSRTDVFSAAVVLYELLTGQKLYQGETQFEVLKKIRSTKIDPSQLPDYIPTPLKAILAKALAYNPNDRYQNAGEFQLDLTKYLYSTHLEFSPRNLADLLKSLFAKELKEKKEEKTIIIDEKTRSVILRASKQEELVVHGEEKEGFFPSYGPAKGGEEASGISRVAKKKKSAGSWFFKTFLLMSFLGAALFGAYKFFPGLIPGLGEKLPQEEGALEKETGKALTPPTLPEEAEEGEAAGLKTGTVEIITNPEGAQVYIDGSITNLKTPAKIEHLKLAQQYTIRVELDHYEPLEKSVTLVTPDPLRLEGNLTPKALGVIEIQSTPSGANVFIDGKVTGKATPAKIENLSIGQSYTLKLTHEQYQDWSQTVAVNSFDPVRLTASLESLPPPSAETPQFGSIRVSSNPARAEIFLNGNSTGKRTPATLTDLEAERRYVIRLVKEGYQDYSERVRIRGGKTSSMVASLVPPSAPEPPAPSPAPVEPEPRYEPPPKKEAPPSAPVRTGGYGQLKINSNPSGAEVYVNAEYKGATPVTISNVPAGTAKVLISKDGFMRYSSSARVTASQTNDLGVIRLEDKFGEVSVHSTPPRATVYFDSQEIGARTPVTIKKVPREQSHSLRVTLGGYRDWTGPVDLTDQQNKKYNITLEKE